MHAPLALTLPRCLTSIGAMPVPDGHSQASRVACRQDPEAVRHHHDSRVQPSTTTSRVIPVASRRDLERFIRLPERLYRGNRNWVAPLRIERRRFLDPRTNPFFEHADVRLFLAVAPDGEVRGRIAAIVNHAHLAQHHDAVGFFGLFECENDADVANALLQAAAAFLRGHGMERMRGPANMSVNDELGLLVEGFDLPPAVMMPYNPPHYRDLLEGFGCQPAMTLFAYSADDQDGQIPERLARGVELAKRRYRCFVRGIDMRRLPDEARALLGVYDAAWSDNWGAVPLTPREVDHLVQTLRLVGDPDLCLLAEVEGRVVGFALTLPDLNQAFSRLDGTLFPFGLFKFLWHRRKIDGARMMAMGVMREYRQMGVDVCLYHETVARGLAKGYRRLEMSWILANNDSMNLVLQKVGARISKTYRVYDYPI